jgi:ABC-type nitrate/sulfonate/bicarbonate transport system ATPase subunit
MKLDISNLRFAYSADKVVINDISISIASGSTFAIVGPSGCGKSTFLQIIAGILSHEKGYVLKGNVSWDGAKNTEDFRRQLKIGYMFQTPILLPHLTIAENVTFPFCSESTRKSLNTSNAASLLESVGLSKFAGHFPDQLSVGMRARVALARTFATEPSLLLLDEPFSSLDVGWRLTLYNQWKLETQQRQLTTVLVTHDVGEAFLLAKRVAVMTTKGEIARVIECAEPRPSTFNLDSMRDFLHRIGDVVEETQYQISRDIVSATEGELYDR